MAQVKKQVPVQETNEYQVKRIQIVKEINAEKVDIDKDCFKHSTLEKIQLKKDKKSFNGNSKEFKDYLIKKILNNPLICGDLKISYKIMKTIFSILFILIFISCNHPTKRKETIHEIYSDSFIYYVTSEITIKEGCASFIA